MPFFILSFILEQTNTDRLCSLEDSDTRTTFKSSLLSEGQLGREEMDNMALVYE